MPGELYEGSNNHGSNPVGDSKAYCEGRAVKAAGGATSANPHVATSDAGIAWLAGYASSVAGPCAE